MTENSSRNYIEVKTEKVLEKGLRKYKVIEFNDVMEYQDLPLEYFGDYPYMYNYGDGVVVFRDEDARATFCIGDIYSSDAMTDLIETMKRCANRLHNINRRIQEKTKKSGLVTKPSCCKTRVVSWINYESTIFRRTNT